MELGGDLYTGNRLHPTQKSMAMLKAFIEAFCPAGGVVLDPFCGSGSTLLPPASLSADMSASRLTAAIIAPRERDLRNSATLSQRDTQC